MSLVEVKAQLPTEQLLEAIGQLNQTELDEFVRQVITLRAKRQAPSLSKTETELLQRINQGIPARVKKRAEVLIAKRQKETLTAQEHAELIQLTEQIEELEAERVTHLAELARLRQVPLGELLTQLGIQPPDYA